MKKNNVSGFTLIEFLIALVIIGFIVAILVGVFSSPVSQARTDSAITQVKDGLRQLADAVSLAAVRNDAGCCYKQTLVDGGYLTAVPPVPAGIGAVASYGRSADPALMIGGCGTNSGAPVTVRCLLRDVTEQFCKDYNAAQGLPATPLSNCSDTPAECAPASGNGEAPVATTAKTFCYVTDTGAYNIVYNSGVPGDVDVEGGGAATCP